MIILHEHKNTNLHEHVGQSLEGIGLGYYHVTTFIAQDIDGAGV